ncbi:MAG: efflux RND transporter periplasmic adaptor subunit [Pirellulaceae bacterium]
MKQADWSTRDLTTCRLKLSDELHFAPQEHAGSTYYHIEVPSSGQFYRVGYPEYVFLSLLDGRTTIAQAVTLSARALGARALSQPKALEVAIWLLENGLAQWTEDSTAGWRTSGTSRRRTAGVLQSFNPFWTKLPLLRPQRLLTGLLPVIGWVFSPLMTAVGLLLIGGGVIVIATHGDRFIASSHLIFSPHNWLSMALVWLGLKIVHELAHALVCKRYGGEVREAGLIFILFAPAAFVDVTSSWRFPSKWQRIHVAAAGMYVELVLAALAAMVWSQAESVVVRHALFNTIVMASLSTLVFNANPLMRFDGYYILGDLLEIPNLATEGTRFVRRLGTRVFYGRVPPARELLGVRGWVVRLYGLAAGLWRLVVCISLLAAASILFKGAGLLLRVAGAACWFGKPVFDIARDLYRSYHEVPLLPLRAGIVAASLACFFYVALVWLPWPATVTAPVVVEYTDLSIVRCGAAGFVDKIHVRDGQHVESRELLLELRNDTLPGELRDLQSSVLQADVLHRAALDGHDAAKAQVALSNRQAAVDRLAEVQRQLESLRIYAPVAGHIVARNLRNAIGTYVHEGAELLAVGDEQRKELLVSVSHEQVDDVTPLLGQVVRFRTGDFRVYEGTLSRLEPRASRRLPHPALSALVGGPLAVSQADAEDHPVESQLVEPQFSGVIAVSRETSPQLACGDRGYALLGLSRESIGQHVWNRLTQWLQQLSKLRQQ